MEENISDLLKLKDTLEIVPDDPYQNVYDEVSEELPSRNLMLQIYFAIALERAIRFLSLVNFVTVKR